MTEIQPNPKCSICRCYFEPTLKTSGLLYKCCDKCREISKENNIKNKCEHNKRRSQCKDCGGSSICEHSRQKYSCKECKKNR